MRSLESIYLAANESELDEVLKGLEADFELDRERVSRNTTYYDTFDWRLWRRGERLEVEATPEGLCGRWVRPGVHSPPALLEREPGLAEDLPATPFGRGLGDIIAMRRLLPVAEVRSEGYSIRLLDRRRKTVARITSDSRKVRRPGSRGRFEGLCPRLRVTEVKGYAERARALVEWIEKRSELEVADTGELEEAVGALGREVGDYGGKSSVKLDPRMPADRAVQQVLSSLLETAVANEDGLVRNLDSEFLHDFRVSVRRTRSALGQIKGVFVAERIDNLRKELSWLGKVTGPVRDLDVYLLKLPGYAARLPESVRGDLAPLEQRLVALHEQEQADLVSALKSPRYRRLKRSWRAFLDQELEETERSPLGRRPVCEVAVWCIRRAHKRVLRKGRAITDESPAERLHRLRLDCKKLRYLMEFFRSLFPKQEIRKSIRDLKGFQDNLGDFQDYGVQQQVLVRLARGLDSRSSGGTEALMAIGRLVAQLEEGEARERERFAASFAKFSSKGTTGRFRDMLEHGGCE